MNDYLKKNKWLLAILIIGVLVRIIYLRFLPTLFFFDQARDLIAVREIVEQHKLKIQGPSASGTNDTVYHGVLYYYFLVPLYIIAQGNPEIIQLLHGLILTTSVIPVFILANKISGSRLTAVVAGLLYVFSSDVVIHGAWLSNPSIATLTIPTFLLCMWLVFMEDKPKWLWLAGLSLALSIQSIVFAGYLLGLFVIFLICKYSKNKNLNITTGQWLSFVLLFFAGLSTMIFTQFRLYKAGIFTWDSFSQTMDSGGSVAGNLLLLHRPYTEKLMSVFTTNSELLSFFIFSISLLLFFKLINYKQRFFYLLSFASPFFLLLFMPRNSLHTVIGLEILFLLPLAAIIAYLIRKKRRMLKTTGYLGLISFVVCQLFFLQKLSINRQYPPAVQPGMYLNDQLDLLNYVYQKADGESFSISTLGNPYRYATTWLYLFSWYGDSNYGYQPTVARQDQTGMYGDYLLAQATQSESTHFSIIEPNLDLDNYFLELFQEEQAQGEAQLMEQTEFGEITVQSWKTAN